MQLSDNRIKELKAFARGLNLRFKNIELLNSAFCHTSYIYEMKLERKESYERLEFLGDAVLKLAVSTLLYNEHELQQEGQLTAIRAEAVSDKTIAKFAEKINMGPLILKGKCDEGSQKSFETYLACSFEALLGAIYIDYGHRGYKKAEQFLLDNFKNEILNVNPNNPKAELQEFTQAYNKMLPKYVLLDEKGPSHDRIFVVGVYFDGQFIDSAEATSKKEAEFTAAQKALAKLKKKFEDKNG